MKRTKKEAVGGELLRISKNVSNKVLLAYNVTYFKEQRKTIVEHLLNQNKVFKNLFTKT